MRSEPTMVVFSSDKIGSPSDFRYELCRSAPPALFNADHAALNCEHTLSVDAAELSAYAITSGVAAA
jgi:hypothetical protein